MNCSITNHFAKVCQKDKCNSDSANALIAHVFYDQQKDIYISCQNNNAKEILVQLKLVQSSQHKFTTLSIFSGSGASICLTGPKHVNQLGIHNYNLIPCNKQVTAFGGSKLQCSGWLPITFQLNEHRTNQPLTAFISEWDRYMYNPMPQGFLAGGDKYTCRYDEIIKDI